MLNRKDALFAGHDRRAENWACIASLIETALCRTRHRQVWTKPLRGRQRWRRPEEGSGTECAAAALTILRCASRRPTRGLAEQVAGDLDYRKTSAFVRIRFSCGDCNKHRVILTTCYAAGLRISETVRLKAAAIDSTRVVVRVEQDKGRKDRYVMLSLLLEILRSYRNRRSPK